VETVKAVILPDMYSELVFDICFWGAVQVRCFHSIVSAGKDIDDAPTDRG